MDTPADKPVPFRSAMRLRASADVARVVQARRSSQAGCVLVYALPNELGHLRLCVSIRRTVAKAHDRNRAKRCVRESFRLIQHELPALDYVVSLRGLPDVTPERLRPTLKKLAFEAAKRALKRGRDQRA